jgi:hypothetical protein
MFVVKVSYFNYFIKVFLELKCHAYWQLGFLHMFVVNHSPSERVILQFHKYRHLYIGYCQKLEVDYDPISVSVIYRL